MTEQAGKEGEFGAGHGVDWRGLGARLRAPRRAPRPGARRVWRVLGGVGLAALALVSVGLGFFFGALARGPIPLDWIAPAVVQSLDEIYRGRFDFELAGAKIANSDHGPTLTVEGLQVKSGGRPVLAAPRAEVSVDVPSLLIGRLKLRRIEVLDLDLRLSVARNGAISIAAGAEAAPVPIQPAPAPVAPQPQAALPSPAAPPAVTPPAAAPTVPAPPHAALMHQVGEVMRAVFDFATSPDSAIGSIDRIGLQHGRLVIDDQTVDRAITYDHLSLSLDRERGGLRVSLAASDRKRRWRLGFTATGANGGARSFDAEARNLAIDEIALIGGLRNLGFDTDAPITANLHFELGEGDHVTAAGGALRLGPGYFRLDEPDHEPIMIETVAATARWDRASRRVLIDPVELKTASLNMTLEGAAIPPPSMHGAPATGGDDDAWNLTLRLAKPAILGPEHAGDRPVAIDRLQLGAKLLPTDKKLTVDWLQLAGPEIAAGLSGVAEVINGAPHVAFMLKVDEARIPALTRLWPTHSGAPARNWIVEHVRSGSVKNGVLSADYSQADIVAMRYGQPPPDRGLRAEFDIANAQLEELLPGLPPFTGVTGHVRVTGRTLSFIATAGAMDTAPGRRLTLVEGDFEVRDNAIIPTPATLDLRIAGNVEAVGDILALPSVSPIASLPLEQGALRGAIDGKVHATFEVGPGARPDRVAVGIEAATQNLSIERFLGAERLEGAALNVVRDAGGLRVSGGGKLFGAPAALDLRRGAGDKGAAQALLTLIFDEAARAKSGFALPGVGGPVAASVKTAVPLTEGDAQVELDFSKTALDGLLPGLVKPAGKPGKASFVLSHKNDGITLEQLLFDVGGTQLAGMVELTRDGGFKAAKFSQVRLSPGDDVRLEIQRGPDAIRATVRGANIDARPIIRMLTQGVTDRGGGQKPTLEDLDVDVKSPIISGFNKQILSNVDLKLERRGGKLRALSLSGQFGREQLAAAMARGGNQVEISTNDAGSLMGFMDFYPRMDSGALNATLQIGQNRTDGMLRIRDFYLRNEPAMRQLMTQGVSRADDRGNVRFDPDAVRFSRLEAGFASSTGALSLRDGVMSGPEIGLTFDGYIDFAREKVDVSGAYVPAYGLNNLLSNIPLLGLVLAGGRHEGIFALNYRVTGALGAPVINVNPLSAIAPGLMRKIMGVMDGTGRPYEPQPAPPAQPAPTPQFRGR